jgi:hypothetical protein
MGPRLREDDTHPLLSPHMRGSHFRVTLKNDIVKLNAQSRQKRARLVLEYH